VRIHSEANFRIAHLVLVCAPSGAGKSTFMRRLASNALPHEIASELPAGASVWPHTNGSRLRGRVVLAQTKTGEATVQGAVLHYDIMRVVDTRISRYADDPALAALAKADEVTVVQIRPTIASISQRTRTHLRQAGGVKRFLKQLEMLFLRRKRASIYLNVNTADRHSRLTELYSRQGFLEERHAEWRRFLDRSASGRIGAIVEVEPTGAGEFRLVNVQRRNDLRTGL
jgi:hypothetical protein